MAILRQYEEMDCMTIFALAFAENPRILADKQTQRRTEGSISREQHASSIRCVAGALPQV